MKKIVRRVFSLWLLILIFQSCMQEEAANFILPEPPVNQLAIIGFLGNNEPPILDISTIASFSEDGFDSNITNASPVLWEGDIAVDTFQYVRCVACDRRLAGAYLGDTLRLQDGVSYKLVVSAPGYETATINFPVFNQVFSPDATVYYDTIYTSTGVEGSVSLRYEIVNNVNFGYIKNIRKDSKFGLTSRRGRFFSPRTFNVWQFLESVSSDRSNPFLVGSTDSLSHGFISRSSPQEFEQQLLDSSVNRHLYAVHMTDGYRDAIGEYLNDTAREFPGGAFVDQQLLVDNVENGYGYVIMVDMVGGRAVLR